MADIGFDTSSYPKPGPPPNPLDNLIKTGQVADVMGNIAAGRAVQQAIDPETGDINRNALAQGLRGSVAGSMKAIPTLNAFEQLRNAGHVADISGLESFQQRMGLVNHVMASIAAMPNPSISDVNSAAARMLDPAIRKYVNIPFPMIMNALKQFRGPDGRALPGDQIKQRALQMATAAGSTAEQLSAMSPRWQWVDDGNTLRPVPVGTQLNPEYPNVTKRIPTGTPQYPPGSRVPVLTPPQPPAPVIRTNGRGQLVGGTPGTTVETDTFGRPIPTTPTNAVMAATQPAPAPPASSPMVPRPVQTEAVQPPAASPNQRVAQSFQDTYGSNLQGAPRAALAPGVAEAATSTAVNSAALGNALVTAANEVPTMRGVLDNMSNVLKDFTPGPGADWKRVGKAFVNANLPEGLVKTLGFDPKSIASQEEFNKLTYLMMQNQFQQLGGTGTDAKLNSTMHTSPNELMSKEGIKNILALSKGNNDALAVKAREWNKWRKTNGEDTFADFSDDFNQHFNPRVFQFQYIPKANRQAWYKAMSPDQRRQFEADADYALAHKWIRP